MSDLIKPTTEDIKQIKIFFEEKYDLLLSDVEANEAYLSLYYLGKALYQYNYLAKGVAND